MGGQHENPTQHDADGKVKKGRLERANHGTGREKKPLVAEAGWLVYGLVRLTAMAKGNGEEKKFLSYRRQKQPHRPNINRPPFSLLRLSLSPSLINTSSSSCLSALSFGLGCSSLLSFVGLWFLELCSVLCRFACLFLSAVAYCFQGD